MSKYTNVEVEGRHLRLSNLDKVLYAEAGFTKRDVLDYYRRVADAMLPHLAGRPLTLKRYPEGVSDEFFYEKQCPSHRPEWIPTARLESLGSKRAEREVNYCLIDSLPALLWAANLASLEMHVLLSRADKPQRPTMVVFDLDPGPPADIVLCAKVAIDLRALLGELGLDAFVKTSGGKGLHLYIPLNTPTTFDQTKGFARAIAGIMERGRGELVTANMRKDVRGGKVFIDWSQNDKHKTTVCVYSLRARSRPTVSMPITWDEVRRLADTGDASAVTFEADAAAQRVQRRGDLFAPVLEMQQELPRID